MSERIRWADVPLIFIPLACCPVPECRERRYERTRTDAGGDGSFSQRRICVRCGAPYRVVFEVEFPDSGNCDRDDE